MSIVRYVDKKSGRVMLYESTSYYDPEKKQSRPKRKYLGVEDPVTGELIPSTKKPGRKAKIESDGSNKTNAAEENLKLKIITLQDECNMKDKQIKELQKKIEEMESTLGNIRKLIN